MFNFRFKAFTYMNVHAGFEQACTVSFAKERLHIYWQGKHAYSICMTTGYTDNYRLCVTDVLLSIIPPSYIATEDSRAVGISLHAVPTGRGQLAFRPC